LVVQGQINDSAVAIVVTGIKYLEIHGKHL